MSVRGSTAKGESIRPRCGAERRRTASSDTGACGSSVSDARDMGRECDGVVGRGGSNRDAVVEVEVEVGVGGEIARKRVGEAVGDGVDDRAAAAAANTVVGA